jgi:hypothetical protein
MKTVFEPTTRQELINRINSLSPQNTAQWGKMDVFQMVKHCTGGDDMTQGEIKIKRVFIGKIIGKMILKKVLKNEKPLQKNSPTASVLKTTQLHGDLEQEKKEWIKRIGNYANFNNLDFVHPFFGPMSKDQVGKLAYKHADHHLRQFGA